VVAEEAVEEVVEEDHHLDHQGLLLVLVREVEAVL
jgi:hypothetical protein